MTTISKTKKHVLAVLIKKLTAFGTFMFKIILYSIILSAMYNLIIDSWLANQVRLKFDKKYDCFSFTKKAVDLIINMFVTFTKKVCTIFIIGAIIVYLTKIMFYFDKKSRMTVIVV